jgi:pimeloyl-ACP methyl ester carboxylesterase
VTPRSDPTAAPEAVERAVDVHGVRLRVQPAERDRVIRPDHPGSDGNSDAPANSPAVHSGLLDAPGDASAVLVGCSSGGWIATEPARREPERITRRLAQPVTLLRGEQDRIVPLSHARSWTDALPAATLAVVPGAGHLPHAEQPDAFSALAGLGIPPR